MSACFFNAFSWLIKNSKYPRQGIFVAVPMCIFESATKQLAAVFHNTYNMRIRQEDHSAESPQRPFSLYYPIEGT